MVLPHIKTNSSAAHSHLWRIIFVVALFILLISAVTLVIISRRPTAEIDRFRAKPFNRVKPTAKPKAKPTDLLNPTITKTIYNLPTTSVGTGTIAIIDAYDDKTVEADLNTFSSQFGLRACTTANGCFEKHKMTNNILSSQDWAIEVALDTQWAHAIAPGAKVLLVEARSSRGSDLLNAINYARNRSDVVAISMSWGGDEFSSESSYESYFTSPYGATFFASSGDSGHGTSWPVEH